MAVVVEVAVTVLVVLAVAQVLVVWLRNAERSEADPAGPVRLTFQERCLVVDLELRTRRAEPRLHAELRRAGRHQAPGSGSGANEPS